MLERMSEGQFYFEIADTLITSLLISSILSNSEVWYGLTKEEAKQLDKFDEMWKKKSV